ncbi:IclR family transcriptional regulator [Comamonas sediminis]|uniref:IclR family transcriptional regulator n=1 Tax=Comamonas sediminis TaxID=1783360 RepID=UPI003D268F68
MAARTTNRNVHPADVSAISPPPPAAQPATRSRAARPVPATAKKASATPALAPAVEDAGSRTLRRGLQVLDAILAGGRDGLRVVELCRAVGLERATVYRLLATLVDSGYAQPRGRFHYVPGPRLAALVPAGATPNMAVRLQPVLARISAACGDAAFAIVREGALSHCIARQVGTHPVQVLVIQVGTRQPLGVGAAGLALLAALPDAQVESIIAANTPQLAAYGGMTPERMRILVRATRERGWSVIGNHATRGVLAAGMAVRNADGEPVAAISVASTLARMPRERQQLIARAIREALQELLPNGV